MVFFMTLFLGLVASWTRKGNQWLVCEPMGGPFQPMGTTAVLVATRALPACKAGAEREARGRRGDLDARVGPKPGRAFLLFALESPTAVNL